MGASRPDAGPSQQARALVLGTEQARWPGTTLAGLRRQDLGQGPKSNTTRQHERPDVIGSSSRAQSRSRARDPLPAERMTNRTQARRSAPDKDPAEVVRSAFPPPVPPNPGRREGAHCHDQHKLTQHLPGPEAPGTDHKHRNPKPPAQKRARGPTRGRCIEPVTAAGSHATAQAAPAESARPKVGSACFTDPAQIRGCGSQTLLPAS
jgi:hypothetical protein